jgi:hypothetical protein
MRVLQLSPGVSGSAAETKSVMASLHLAANLNRAVPAVSVAA